MELVLDREQTEKLKSFGWVMLLDKKIIVLFDKESKMYSYLNYEIANGEFGLTLHSEKRNV